MSGNMLANEMYLDSADIRANIVSLSKILGYTILLQKQSVANVDITINGQQEQL